MGGDDGQRRSDDTVSLLQRMQGGDAGAGEELMELVHDELRRIAGRLMRDQRPGHTLQPTALVNEAYAKLVGGQGAAFSGRSHFLAVAARAMRSILVDHARSRRRSSDLMQGLFGELVASYEERSGGLVELDQQLERLARVDPPLARVVDLRFFAGMTVAEVAEALGVSKRKVERDLKIARGMLGAGLGAAPS